MEDMEEITLTGATEGDEASRREKFKGTAVYKALQKFEAREVAAHDVIAALQDESCLPDASLTIHLAAASDDAWARMVLSAEFFVKILHAAPEAVEVEGTMSRALQNYDEALRLGEDLDEKENLYEFRY